MQLSLKCIKCKLFAKVLLFLQQIIYESEIYFLNLFIDVVVHKDGYASYTQTVAASKVNHFQVQFRTKDHTGLLLHAKGGSDFLTLELIRGRLR